MTANFDSLVQEAERLGFDSVWTAEAWGSDAFTPLAWIGAHTERIRLFLASARTKSVKVNWPSCASANSCFAQHLNLKLALIYRTGEPPTREKATNLS